MDLSDSDSTSIFDMRGQVCDSTCPRCVTVKFATNDGKVFTQSYPEDATIGDIKTILVEVFAVPFGGIVIRKGQTHICDDRRLNEFELGEYKMLEFELYSTALEHPISADAAYEGYGIPDVITVRVDDSDDDDGYRDVVVEIIDSTIKKPFLGGYVHKDSGIEYHHGYSQTGPPPPKVPPERKNHRDTQTYFWRNRLLDTKYAHATQMANEELFIPNVTDKILTAGPYETADEWEKRRAVEDKVRTIQRYYRAYRIRQALKILSAEYKKRIRLEQEEEEFYIKDNEDRKKQEFIAKVFPRTKDDFCMLFAMVDRWKKAEIKRICNSYTGAAKITAFYMLLDKEIEMLKAIEGHRDQIKKDLKAKKEKEFFETIGNPIAWHNHYKDWTSKYKDLYIQMDTLETQQGHAYFQIFLSISDKNSDVEDRIQALLNIKLLLHDHNCQLSSELVSLIDRACELMVRGINNQHLDILMKRIQGMLKKHIKTPECSFGVTNRMQRVKEKLMHTDLHLCKYCQKLKPADNFALHAGIEQLNVCISCSWNDRVMEPWFDLAPYRYLLRIIKREELRKQTPSSVIFILEPRDIFYIVETIWHSHSAISEEHELYDLRLPRWFHDKPWAPWNCVLLTTKETKLHLNIKKLDEVYDDQLMCRVLAKQQLGRVHFKDVVRLDNYIREMEEIDEKWNELTMLKQFVHVTSKTQVPPRCH